MAAVVGAEVDTVAVAGSGALSSELHCLGQWRASGGESPARATGGAASATPWIVKLQLYRRSLPHPLLCRDDGRQGARFRGNRPGDRCFTHRHAHTHEEVGGQIQARAHVIPHYHKNVHFITAIA